MSSLGSCQATPKLSICITTLNRAAFIGATLESILLQATDECELIVLDAASTDGTEQLVSEYGRRFGQLRYIRQAQNNGIDRDLNNAVELARGEYCWLMTDDDLMKPGAVDAVLAALRRKFSLVIVNTEIRDLKLQKILQGRWPDFESDRVYGPDELDRLVVEVGGLLNCNACVIKREIWLERNKEPYYGSLLIHLGVIFQARLPEGALVMAEPLISYRRGNAHTFSPRFGELVLSTWPSLVDLLPLSDRAKQDVPFARPWRHPQELLLWRARGHYSMSEYRRWVRSRLRSRREALIPILVAVLPGVLVNMLFVAYYSITRLRYHGMWQPPLILHWMQESRYYFLNWLRG
jgi:abequosyltransferase